MRHPKLGEIRQLFSDAVHPVLITGAGISASSGLATFRGPGGMSEGPDAQPLPVHRDDWEARPDDVVAFVASIAAASDAAAPSAAHHAIAGYLVDCESRGGAPTLSTMNIDDLHERAGVDAHHLHGRAHRWRCDDCGRGFSASATRCDHCRSRLRPDVVLYGEALDQSAAWETKRALRDPDLLAVIGASGSSYQLQRWVRYATTEQQIPTVLITIAPDPAFAALFSHVADVDVADLPRLLGRRSLLRSALSRT